MSEIIKHECGVAFLRLKKPLSYYQEKYGSALYGVEKMQLLMQKQINRGQDGAGIANIKLNTNPGERNDPSSNYSYENKCFWDILHTFQMRRS